MPENKGRNRTIKLTNSDKKEFKPRLLTPKTLNADNFYG